VGPRRRRVGSSRAGAELGGSHDGWWCVPVFFLFLARDLGSCCGCEAWGSPVRERQPRQRSDRGRLVGSHRAVAYLSAPSLLFLPASFFFPTGSSGAGQSRDLPSRARLSVFCSAFSACRPHSMSMSAVATQ
jgi:hypothetical protein